MYKVTVYIDTGNKHTYEVDNPMKGREHAAAIIQTGFRHSTKDGDLEWYPASRIVKVRVQGGAESSDYRDVVQAT